ncbi:uncharacterized protein BHQ10_006792 [Talaromyces amestolkiae]|uniref:TM7S3/TM198-like domain-containing protein n=1 Tax=Talaromyces amestolkiae TaxID=1196081 RepID=A0A364L4Q1_TALAM|nr:uncharacterized protein BHQ10_006792 [Talaromyces amestolkiae]RAO70780.1 hypothetical protein BHQ10_006792 [Talaromyces amestolkiae]
MHCHRVLSICLCVLFGIAADAAVHRRQDVLTTSSLQNAQPTKQTTGSISTATGPSDTDSPNVSVTASTTMIDIHTDISNPQPTLEPTLPNTVNGTLDVNALPIQPTITPSIGITGVVLMITGLAYNIIGIKNQWLHVFLSTAFLSSLSVTVLIEYVMSPPVSNAIQGAYFVAAFLTGLIFGALSLIFKELTEGLGCLLGGFCVSMWLLSLKRGGLLADSDTRGAFIGAFCVAFYALSFSSYTRPYGLIVSTAFAGSSIAVLGIDCFSRAGWKEFWLYIWGLNDNLFPFGTSTYPVTRGIRVELAVTVVVCLLGLLSQFKLWKLIRERRNKQEEALAEERRKKDEAEVELGRAIEEKKENDLVRWEAIYGDKGNPTTTQTPAVETQPQTAPVELVEAPDNSVEMVDLPATPLDMTENHGIAQEDNQKSDDAEKEATAEQDKVEASQNPDADSTCANDEPKAKNQDETAVLSAPHPPPVTPLPFRVPNPGSRPVTGDGDAHSIQVIIDDIDTASSANKRRSRLQSDSDEMLIPIPPASSTYSDKTIEDSEDGSDLGDAQSVDIDDLELPDTDRLDNESNDKTLQDAACSTETAVINPPPPVTEEATNPLDAKSSVGRLDDQTEKVPSTKDTASTNGTEDTGLGIVTDKRRHTVDGATCILSKFEAPSLVQMTDSTSKPTQANTKEEKAEILVAPLSIPKSKSSSGKKEDLTSDIVKKIPSHVSPVVMSYRTNEWAKHLSHADAPVPEPLENLADTERPISPELIEVAAPLNVEQLKQTALTASPPPLIEASALPPPEEVVYNTAERSTSSISGQSARVVSPRQSIYEQPINVKTPPTTFSPEVVTSESTLTLPIANRSPARIIPNGLRSVSSPLLSTVAAQSSLQNPARNSTHGQGTEGEPYSLMAQRERLIQARLSSVSLTQDAWAPRNKSRQSLEEGYRSRPDSQLSMVEEDDMPLTHRRALLQQRAISPISPISPILGMDTDVRRSPVDIPPLIGARLSRESRELSKPKVSTMAAWRESLQEDLSKHKPLLDVDHAQTELMEQQRKAQIARHQRLQASENLHNSIAERMRRGDMQDLHREAMRRMQAAANRKVNK